jgi:hypothetical protein
VNRTCPNCTSRSIPISGLLVSNCRCPGCGAIVSVRPLCKALWALATVSITIPFVLAVLASQGVYAAILLATLPIAALGYIKARFCRLVARPLEID